MTEKGENKMEEWLWVIGKAFDVIELPKRLKLKYGSYMLLEDEEAW